MSGEHATPIGNLTEEYFPHGKIMVQILDASGSVPANIGASVYSKLRQDPLRIFEYTALLKNRIFEYTGFCGHFVMSILVLVVQVTRRRRTCTIGPSGFFCPTNISEKIAIQKNISQ